MILMALSSIAMAVSVPPARDLDLAGFFSGRTHAENDLKIIFHRPTKLIVDSVGKRQGSEFIQTDIVHEGDKPVRTRVWRTHEVSPGHFAGTLSDATGPVDIAVHGNSVVIRYTMKGGLDIFETMQLQRDGRTLSNNVVAKKLGLTFAHVEGSIRKLD
ncbi:MAG TPA: DUF3833 family protein [Sphingomicrobium sp.]|nr:DUF3833 family protein [Sphingomicrobium sp.]